MRRKNFFLTDINNDSVAYEKFQSAGTYTPNFGKMKRVVSKAIKNELTPKQRYCLLEYYLKGRSMKDIADELDLNPSTVTRHIQNAVSRLQRVARYY